MSSEGEEEIPVKKASTIASSKKEKVEKGNVDIRGFFGGSQPQSAKKPTPKPKPASSSSKKDPEPIELGDSDDGPIPTSSKRTSSASNSKLSTTASSFKKRVIPASSESESEPFPSKSKPKPAATKAAAARKPPAKKQKVEESSSDSEGVQSKKAREREKEDAAKAKPAAKGKAPAKKPTARKQVVADDDDDDNMNDFVVDDNEDEGAMSTPNEDDEDDSKSCISNKKAAPAPKKAASKPKPKKAVVDDEEDDDGVNIDAEETAKTDKKKSNFAAFKARQSSGPAAPGSKEAPDGKPNCLAGLKFVFTGELSSFSREEATELAKRFGALVTTTPSGVTSFVVVGENAGPSKLAKIKTLGVKTLDEDGFLNLIATRGSAPLDAKTKKKMAEEEAKIKKVAKEMEAKEKEDEEKRKSAEKKGGKVKATSSAQIWTTKYAPKTLSDICGNKSNVEKLMEWLKNWDSSARSGFKKPGKHAMGTHRAVLISGSPGIGKTTTAHLVGKACGYEPLEMNASDSRSKKLIESGTNIDNGSLDGYFAGGGATTAAGVKITLKTVLIMDEVDGMSGGDRGGVGAMNALVRKTKIPIILICNDAKSPKMKPFQATTYGMPFKKPSPAEIRSRIMSVAFREKLKIQGSVVDQLISGANSDIRQVLNMLMTWKLSKNNMSFEEGKDLAKMNEKNTIQTPFTLCDKILGPYMFSATNRLSLSEKMDFYFQDFSFVPLFIQDNYPKQKFARSMKLSGPEKALKDLELMSKAADSISHGDLVDKMIHGTDQQWSLLPVHAVLSTIRPAYFTFGAGGGWGGPYGMAFPAWMGNNSKQTKNRRILSDIHIHMRLKISANAQDVRLNYIPTLFPKLFDPLFEKTDVAENVSSVIQVMDDYFLDREDWDSILDLGVGEYAEPIVSKNIATATKTAFTRTYNKQEHPVAFYKGINMPAGKKVTGESKPDLEDVYDASEHEESDAEEPAVDGDDFSKDKMVKNKAKKIPAAKKAPAKTASAKKAPAKQKA